MSVECECAGVGGFESPMNALSWNAAERNAPRACARLGTRVPLPSGQLRHGVLELCCRPRPLVGLPLSPSPPLLLLLLLPMPQTTGGGVWREPEPPSRATPGAGQSARRERAPGLGRGQGAGAGRGGASRKLTHCHEPVVPGSVESGREREEAWRAGQAGARGLGGVERECAGDEAEHPRELRASHVCRLQKRWGCDSLDVFITYSYSYSFSSPLLPLPLCLFTLGFVCQLLYLPLLSFSGTGRKKERRKRPRGGHSSGSWPVSLHLS